MARSRAKPGTPYAAARAQMSTLDLLLFRGAGVESRCISCAQRCCVSAAHDYTHVGLCVRGESLPPGQRFGDSPVVFGAPGRVWVLEATQAGFAPCGCGDGAPSLSAAAPDFVGSQLRDLDAVAAAYDAPARARLAWAPLADAERAAADAVPPHALAGIITRYLGAPYPFSALQLCAALLPCLRPARDARLRRCWLRCLAQACACPAGCADVQRWQVCSELAARVLADAGVAADGLGDPRNVLPIDFLPVGADGTADADAAVPRLVGAPQPYTMFART